MRTMAVMMCALAMLRAAGAERQREARAAPARGSQPVGDAPVFGPDGPLWMEMRNVDLHIDERAALYVRRLRGEVISTKPGTPAVLDDATSFSIRVTSGTIALGGDALAALLNGRVFAYRGAPLSHIRVRIAAPYVIQSGMLHKGVDLPFEMTGTIALEPDGRVRLHPVRTRILGVDGAKLLHALGLHLEDLVDLSGSRGASVRGDDLLLAPTEILPPPGIQGRLASIRADGSVLVQEFVHLPEDSVFDGAARPDSAAANFINFHGGQLQFGKLLMTDTDLQIIDADERDPLDLYLARYSRQLVAGTSRTLPSLGLRVVMPDYRVVAAARPQAAAVGAEP